MRSQADALNVWPWISPSSCPRYLYLPFRVDHGANGRATRSSFLYHPSKVCGADGHRGVRIWNSYEATPPRRTGSSNVASWVRTSWRGRSRSSPVPVCRSTLAVEQTKASHFAAPAQIRIKCCPWLNSTAQLCTSVTGRPMLTHNHRTPFEAVEDIGAISVQCASTPVTSQLVEPSGEQ